MKVARKKPLLGLIVAILVGLAIGTAAQFKSKSPSTTYYYEDLCLSIGGCCPDKEGITQDGRKFCPGLREGSEIGFPIRADSVETKPYILAANLCLFVVVTSTVYYLAYKIIAF